MKVIRPDRTDPHTRARFEREATIARTISGTGRVARFIDADPFAEQPWLAMDYLPGRPLSDVVRDQGPLTASLVASLGALLAEGLAAVHTAGLLHRDLKAQNVILSDFGPVIIDFGLGAFFGASKGSLTQAGAVIGTVRCMPPEQALGELDATQAADVYGLGTVLLYSATGHYPYDGARWEAVAAQVVNPEIGPDLSGLPDELAPVVTAMLAHKAEDRPSLEEVTRQCADLLRLLGTSPARARRALMGTPNNRLARRLAEQTDALILASATPHNGNAESFAELIEMLDPAAIADAKNYKVADLDHLYIRRTKTDREVRDGLKGKPWAERGPSLPVPAPATPKEVAVLEKLASKWTPGIHLRGQASSVSSALRLQHQVRKDVRRTCVTRTA
ncbi:protein kinase [Streptomyces sp. NPDC096046]|uniref:protein kinase domain-containing protein n=1 Tax=Streptomyces sp. NPDC096046 TaxID=3155542 RepID=UPI00331C8233